MGSGNSSLSGPGRNPAPSVAAPLSVQNQSEAQPRAFVVAWAFTVIFYFPEYAVRSSPSVMIPELEAAFNRTALGVATILGIYYYSYRSNRILRFPADEWSNYATNSGSRQTKRGSCSPSPVEKVGSLS
jgi:hypothetical protein